MKELIIKEENRETINNAIREVEGRAKARTITYDDCVRAVNSIDKRLNLPKAVKSGITANVDIYAQTFANSYKGEPYSTKMTLIYRNGSWRITDIYRSVTRAQTQQYLIDLTEKAKEELIKRRISECSRYCE